MAPADRHQGQQVATTTPADQQSARTAARTRGSPAITARGCAPGAGRPAEAPRRWPRALAGPALPMPGQRPPAAPPRAQRERGGAAGGTPRRVSRTHPHIARPKTAIHVMHRRRSAGALGGGCGTAVGGSFWGWRGCRRLSLLPLGFLLPPERDQRARQARQWREGLLSTRVALPLIWISQDPLPPLGRVQKGQITPRCPLLGVGSRQQPVY